MKNFSELLATELLLEFYLAIDSFHSAIDVEVWLNDQLIYDDLLTKTFVYSTQLNLLDPINLRICVHDKDYSTDSQSAVLIQSVRIDDFDIAPNWTQLAKYTNDHHYTEPTTHLGFNGVWQYNIPEPFYQWKHKITGQGWLLTP